VGPITMWVISTTRTPVNGRPCVLNGVSRGSLKLGFVGQISLPSAIC
jgi:hypothetical protein